jgi:Spy/CpxP family protein refolding chaperone
MLFWGATALAQPGPASRHNPPPERGERQLMQKLGLSEKQKSDIASLRTEMQKSLVGIQAKIKLARIDLGNLVRAESPDKTQIESKMKEINDLQFQEKTATVDHLFAVYNLLTPEQKKTFREHMMMRMSGGMHPMMQHWQGFRRGMREEESPR